ncbi:armadillo-type protein [Kockovaella imperatae]|uniref:Importin-95 n=1 Tax=Kockovaella imperatae TaxID=4999 RepID=A0A1Y1U8R9_9TREE|nr:armadillo-type protein [Kockovaella imperatae]ORX34440.1 armadillo-type protein [Kockovaella imperatae]
MDAAQLLENSLSPDPNIREPATRELENASKDNYHGYLHTLAATLANEQTPPHIRRAAGLAFKNALAARDAANQSALSDRWLQLPDDATLPLKQSLLSTLGSQQHAAGAVAAQCVSAIAAIELKAGKWQDLIPTLLQFIGNQENTGLRVNTLQAIGYVCEVIEPQILAAQSNDILTGVVQGARKEEPSQDVQAAAIHALYNSLEFISDNFQREGERNYIMQVVCEATQSPSVTVQVGAFECLVRIMSLYYDKMDYYMERALFGLTIMGMRHPEEPVALQAIEFWSTVCDEEIDLDLEASEAAEYGELPTFASKHFARMAMPEILPVLLDLLSQQSEDDDEDEWTKSMAAGSCLELMARNVGDGIVQPVVPFVEAGIHQPEWQRREAAVMAFGSILDGPDPSTLAPLVTQALGALIGMMASDPSLQVRDTVAWTLSRITEVMFDVISPDAHLDSLVPALLNGLNGQTASPRIINSCCSALSNLAAQLTPLGDSGDAPTSPMSKYYPDMLRNLMTLSEKSTNDSNSRTAAYQTIATLIASSATDTLPLVQDVVIAMLARQEALMGMQGQLLGTDDRNNWNDMQINLCVVIQSVIHKSPSMINQFADRIMTNLLQLISSSGKQSGVLEDAFATVGAMATGLESAFTKYMEAFSQFMYTALRSHEDWQVCQAAVYVVSDISRAINEALTPYAENIMVALIEVLRTPVIHRSVKPNAITAIGEVALAIGPGFKPFLQTTMEILSQAGATTAQSNDAAMIEFVWTMREAIVDAFIGIMNGLKTDPEPFKVYVGGICGFLRDCWNDDDRTDQFATSTLGLLGDFGDTYKSGVSNELMQPWVSSAISYGREPSSSRQLKTNAAYAFKAIKELENL